MKKTLSLAATIFLAALGLAASTGQSAAATRLMSSSPEGFEFRCERYDGIFAQDGFVVSCQTPSVPVSCEYFDGRQASCVWAGIENQIDVVRVIGTLPAGTYATSSGGDNDSSVSGGKGGGFQGPKDIKDAPNNDPKPNFDGPKDFQMAP